MTRTDSYAYYFNRDDRQLIAKALTAYKKELKAQLRDGTVDLEEYNRIEMAAADEMASVMELDPKYYQPEAQPNEKANPDTADKDLHDARWETAEQLLHKTYGQIPPEYRNLLRTTVRPARRKSCKYLLTFRIQGMSEKRLYIPDDQVSYKRAVANIIPALYLAASRKDSMG
jgi:hypothetical protein